MPTPVKSTFASANGSRIFQLKASIWSIRVRGNVQRNHMNTNTIASTFRPNHTTPGKNGPFQPPRKNTVVRIETDRRFAYSARKNSAQRMPLYSANGPATISASPYTRSNGTRFVSAVAEITNTTKAIGCIRMNQSCSDCAFTMSDIRMEPDSITTPRSEKTIGAS